MCFSLDPVDEVDRYGINQSNDDGEEQEHPLALWIVVVARIGPSPSNFVSLHDGHSGWSCVSGSHHMVSRSTTPIRPITTRVGQMRWL